MNFYDYEFKISWISMILKKIYELYDYEFEEKLTYS